MKKIPGIFAAVTVISLMAFVALLGERIGGLNVELDEAFLVIEDKEMQLETVTEEKLLLEVEVAELKAEIKKLKAKITALEKDLSGYEARIKNLRKDLDKMKKKVTVLKKEIDQLKQKGNHNNKEISILEQEKQHLEQEIQYFKNKEKMLKDVQQETIQEVAETQNEAENLNNIRAIITDAVVEFQGIGLLKGDGGGLIKKIKGKDNKWKYTAIKLAIKHSNSDLLGDLDFVLKILDLDTGKILPFNESNPQYPNSTIGRNGYLFKYHGNLAEVLYYNNEIKRGMNYEARIYVRLNGEDVPLTNGRVSIVNHGKAVILN